MQLLVGQSFNLLKPKCESNAPRIQNLGIITIRNGPRYVCAVTDSEIEFGDDYRPVLLEMVWGTMIDSGHAILRLNLGMITVCYY